MSRVVYTAKISETTSLIYSRDFEPFEVPTETAADVVAAMSQGGDGLGDRTERMLTRYGVTQDRYKEIKAKFGLVPECGCADRIEWLNRVGRYVESQGATVSKSLRRFLSLR